MNETYRAMEEALLSLMAAGSSEGLFNHLVAMAQMAGQLGRPDLAALSLRTAGEVARGAGVDNREALRELEKSALEAMAVPFESFGDELEVLKEHVRRMLRLAARKRVLEGRLHPDLRFEYEVTGQEFDSFLRPSREVHDVELFSLERDVPQAAWQSRRVSPRQT